MGNFLLNFTDAQHSRGSGGATREYALDHDFAAATTNARDFVPLLNAEVHPGLIVLRESGLTRDDNRIELSSSHSGPSKARDYAPFRLPLMSSMPVAARAVLSASSTVELDQPCFCQRQFRRSAAHNPAALSSNLLKPPHGHSMSPSVLCMKY